VGDVVAARPERDDCTLSQKQTNRKNEFSKCKNEAHNYCMSRFWHSSVVTKSVGDAIALIPKEEMIAPNCFLAHIYPLHQISFIINMVSTRLFFPQSRTVSPLSCQYILTGRLNFFLTSPMKHAFAHAYTHRHHPRYVTSLWLPDKYVPQSTLVFPYPKITSANYRFSRICTIVQLLFTKAAMYICFMVFYKRHCRLQANHYLTTMVQDAGTTIRGDVVVMCLGSKAT
jgi:hypothetical protein